MATVICQHSKDPEDLHLHDISILCDGHVDCYSSVAMNDESFPYCEERCNSTCSHHGACLFDGKRAQCYCNSGFQGPSCQLTDTNECNDKPCHWMAKCQNTFGSYRCECYPGFEGNGYECTDIDECADGLADCPNNSVCVNLPGTYMCNCSQGYIPKGAPVDKCVDIDECDLGLAKCGHKLCQNLIGDYKCVDECEGGYNLKDGKCVDVDECMNGQNTCDVRSVCHNKPGGYDCFCDEGFVGDGRSCSPIYDCTQKEGICDRHAYCLKSLKMCVCQSGYAGDGYSCRDINECNASMNPCAQQEKNECVNVEGGYICCNQMENEEKCLKDSGLFCSGGCGVNSVCFNQTCTCVPGYEGDPKVRCLDVNECHQDNICTGAGQWCVNLAGGHICCTPDSDYPECRGLELVPDVLDRKAIAVSDANAKNKNGNGNKAEANSFAQVNGIRGELEETEFATQEKIKRRRFRTKTVHIGRQLKTHSGGFVLIRRPKERLFRNETTGEFDLKEIPDCPNGEDSECPEHSVCFSHHCRCRLGFDWSRLKGTCEDVNECLGQNPCPNSPKHKESWCVNTFGGYHCCHTGMDMEECDGMAITYIEPSVPVDVTESDNKHDIFKTASYGELRKKVSKHIIFGRGRIPAQKLWGLELTGKGLFAGLPGFPGSEEGPTDQAPLTSVSTTLFNTVSISPLEGSLVGPRLPSGNELADRSQATPETTGTQLTNRKIIQVPVDETGNVQGQFTPSFFNYSGQKKVGDDGQFRSFNRTEGNSGLVSTPKQGLKVPVDTFLNPQKHFVIPTSDFGIPDIHPNDFAEILVDQREGKRKTLSSFNQTAGSVGLVLGPNRVSKKKSPFAFRHGVKFTTIHLQNPNEIFKKKTKGRKGDGVEGREMINVSEGQSSLVLRTIKPNSIRPLAKSNPELFSTTTEPSDATRSIFESSKVAETTTTKSDLDRIGVEIIPEGFDQKNHEEEFIPHTPTAIENTRLNHTVNEEEWVLQDGEKRENIQIPESQETLVLTAQIGFQKSTKVPKTITSDAKSAYIASNRTKDKLGSSLTPNEPVKPTTLSSAKTAEQAATSLTTKPMSSTIIPLQEPSINVETEKISIPTTKLTEKPTEMIKNGAPKETAGTEVIAKLTVPAEESSAGSTPTLLNHSFPLKLRESLKKTSENYKSVTEITTEKEKLVSSTSSSIVFEEGPMAETENIFNTTKVITPMSKLTTKKIAFQTTVLEADILTVTPKTMTEKNTPLRSSSGDTTTMAKPFPKANVDNKTTTGSDQLKQPITIRPNSNEELTNKKVSDSTTVKTPDQISADTSTAGTSRDGVKPNKGIQTKSPNASRETEGPAVESEELTTRLGKDFERPISLTSAPVMMPTDTFVPSSYKMTSTENVLTKGHENNMAITPTDNGVNAPAVFFATPQGIEDSKKSEITIIPNGKTTNRVTKIFVTSSTKAVYTGSEETLKEIPTKKAWVSTKVRASKNSNLAIRSTETPLSKKVTLTTKASTESTFRTTGATRTNVLGENIKVSSTQPGTHQDGMDTNFIPRKNKVVESAVQMNHKSNTHRVPETTTMKMAVSTEDVNGKNIHSIRLLSSETTKKSASSPKKSGKISAEELSKEIIPESESLNSQQISDESSLTTTETLPAATVLSSAARSRVSNEDKRITSSTPQDTSNEAESTTNIRHSSILPLVQIAQSPLKMPEKSKAPDIHEAKSAETLSSPTSSTVSAIINGNRKTTPSTTLSTQAEQTTSRDKPDETARISQMQLTPAIGSRFTYIETKATKSNNKIQSESTKLQGIINGLVSSSTHKPGKTSIKDVTQEPSTTMPEGITNHKSTQTLTILTPNDESGLELSGNGLESINITVSPSDTYKDKTITAKPRPKIEVETSGTKKHGESTELNSGGFKFNEHGTGMNKKEQEVEKPLAVHEDRRNFKSHPNRQYQVLNNQTKKTRVKGSVQKTENRHKEIAENTIIITVPKQKMLTKEENLLQKAKHSGERSSASFNGLKTLQKERPPSFPKTVTMKTAAERIPTTQPKETKTPSTATVSAKKIGTSLENKHLPVVAPEAGEYPPSTTPTTFEMHKPGSNRPSSSTTAIKQVEKDEFTESASQETTLISGIQTKGRLWTSAPERSLEIFGSDIQAIKGNDEEASVKKTYNVFNGPEISKSSHKKKITGKVEMIQTKNETYGEGTFILTKNDTLEIITKAINLNGYPTTIAPRLATTTSPADGEYFKRTEAKILSETLGRISYTDLPIADGNLRSSLSDSTIIKTTENREPKEDGTDLPFITESVNNGPKSITNDGENTEVYSSTLTTASQNKSNNTTLNLGKKKASAESEITSTSAPTPPSSLEPPEPTEKEDVFTVRATQDFKIFENTTEKENEEIERLGDITKMAFFEPPLKNKTKNDSILNRLEIDPNATFDHITKTINRSTYAITTVPNLLTDDPLTRSPTNGDFTTTETKSSTESRQLTIDTDVPLTATDDTTQSSLKVKAKEQVPTETQSSTLDTGKSKNDNTNPGKQHPSAKIEEISASNLLSSSTSTYTLTHQVSEKITETPSISEVLSSTTQGFDDQTVEVTTGYSKQMFKNDKITGITKIVLSETTFQTPEQTDVIKTSTKSTRMKGSLQTTEKINLMVTKTNTAIDMNLTTTEPDDFSIPYVPEQGFGSSQTKKTTAAASKKKFEGRGEVSTGSITVVADLTTTEKPSTQLKENTFSTPYVEPGRKTITQTPLENVNFTNPDTIAASTSLNPERLSTSTSGSKLFTQPSSHFTNINQKGTPKFDSTSTESPNNQTTALDNPETNQPFKASTLENKPGLSHGKKAADADTTRTNQRNDIQRFQTTGSAKTEISDISVTSSSQGFTSAVESDQSGKEPVNFDSFSTQLTEVQATLATNKEDIRVTKFPSITQITNVNSVGGDKLNLTLSNATSENIVEQSPTVSKSQPNTTTNPKLWVTLFKDTAVESHTVSTTLATGLKDALEMETNVTVSTISPAITKGYNRHSTIRGVKTVIPRLSSGDFDHRKATTPYSMTETPRNSESSLNPKEVATTVQEQSTSILPNEFESTWKSQPTLRSIELTDNRLESSSSKTTSSQRITADIEISQRSSSASKRINGKVETIQQKNEIWGEETVVIKPEKMTIEVGNPRVEANNPTILSINPFRKPSAPVDIVILDNGNSEIPYMKINRPSSEIKVDILRSHIPTISKAFTRKTTAESSANMPSAEIGLEIFGSGISQKSRREPYENKREMESKGNKVTGNKVKPSPESGLEIIGSDILHTSIATPSTVLRNLKGGSPSYSPKAKSTTFSTTTIKKVTESGAKVVEHFTINPLSVPTSEPTFRTTLDLKSTTERLIWDISSVTTEAKEYATTDLPMPYSSEPNKGTTVRNGLELSTGSSSALKNGRTISVTEDNFNTTRKSNSQSNFVKSSVLSAIPIGSTVIPLGPSPETVTTGITQLVDESTSVTDSMRYSTPDENALSLGTSQEDNEGKRTKAVKPLSFPIHTFNSTELDGSTTPSTPKKYLTEDVQSIGKTGPTTAEKSKNRPEKFKTQFTVSAVSTNTKDTTKAKTEGHGMSEELSTTLTKSGIKHPTISPADSVLWTREYSTFKHGIPSIPDKESTIAMSPNEHIEIDSEKENEKEGKEDILPDIIRQITKQETNIFYSPGNPDFTSSEHPTKYSTSAITSENDTPQENFESPQSSFMPRTDADQTVTPEGNSKSYTEHSEKPQILNGIPETMVNDEIADVTQLPPTNTSMVNPRQATGKDMRQSDETENSTTKSTEKKESVTSEKPFSEITTRKGATEFPEETLTGTKTTTNPKKSEEIDLEITGKGLKKKNKIKSSHEVNGKSTEHERSDEGLEISVKRIQLIQQNVKGKGEKFVSKTPDFVYRSTKVYERTKNPFVSVSTSTNSSIKGSEQIFAMKTDKKGKAHIVISNPRMTTNEPVKEVGLEIHGINLFPKQTEQRLEVKLLTVPSETIGRKTELTPEISDSSVTQTTNDKRVGVASTTEPNETFATQFTEVPADITTNPVRVESSTTFANAPSSKTAERPKPTDDKIINVSMTITDTPTNPPAKQNTPDKNYHSRTPVDNITKNSGLGNKENTTETNTTTEKVIVVKTGFKINQTKTSIPKTTSGKFKHMSENSSVAPQSTTGETDDFIMTKIPKGQSTKKSESISWYKTTVGDNEKSKEETTSHATTAPSSVTSNIGIVEDDTTTLTTKISLTSHRSDHKPSSEKYSTSEFELPEDLISITETGLNTLRYSETLQNNEKSLPSSTTDSKVSHTTTKPTLFRETARSLPSLFQAITEATAIGQSKTTTAETENMKATEERFSSTAGIPEAAAATATITVIIADPEIPEGIILSTAKSKSHPRVATSPKSVMEQETSEASATNIQQSMTSSTTAGEEFKTTIKAHWEESSKNTKESELPVTTIETDIGKTVQDELMTAKKKTSVEEEIKINEASINLTLETTLEDPQTHKNTKTNTSTSSRTNLPSVIKATTKAKKDLIMDSTRLLEMSGSSVETPSSDELVPAIIPTESELKNNVQPQVSTPDGLPKIQMGNDSFVMSFESSTTLRSYPPNIVSSKQEVTSAITSQSTTNKPQKLSTMETVTVWKVANTRVPIASGVIPTEETSSFTSESPLFDSSESSVKVATKVKETTEMTLQTLAVRPSWTPTSLPPPPTVPPSPHSTHSPKFAPKTNLNIPPEEGDYPEIINLSEKIHSQIISKNPTTTIIPEFSDIFPTNSNDRKAEERLTTASPTHFTKLQRETTFDGDHETQSALKNSFGLVISGHPKATTAEVGLVIGRLTPIEDNSPPEREEEVPEISLPQSASSEVVEIDEATESPEHLLKKVNELLIRQGHQKITPKVAVPEDELSRKTDNPIGFTSPFEKQGLEFKEGIEPLEGDVGLDLIQKGRKVQWKNRTIEEGKRVNLTYPASTIQPFVITLPENEIEETTQKSGNMGLEISGKLIEPEEMGLEINGGFIRTDNSTQYTSTTKSPDITIDETDLETLDREQLIKRVKELTTHKDKIEISTVPSKEKTSSKPEVVIEGENVEKMDRDELIQKLKASTLTSTKTTGLLPYIRTTTKVTDIVPDRGATEVTEKQEWPKNPRKRPEAHNELGLELLGKDLETTELPSPTKPNRSSNKILDITMDTPQPFEHGLIISGSDLKTPGEKKNSSIPENLRTDNIEQKTATFPIPETPHQDEQGLIISDRGIETVDAEETTTENPKSTTKSTSEKPIELKALTNDTPSPNEKGLVISGEDLKRLTTEGLSKLTKITIKQEKLEAETTEATSTPSSLIEELLQQKTNPTFETPKPDEQGLMISGKDIETIRPENPEASTLETNSVSQLLTVETSKPNEQRVTISEKDIETSRPKPDSDLSLSTASTLTSEPSSQSTLETPHPEEQGLIISGKDIRPFSPEPTKSSSSPTTLGTAMETQTPEATQPTKIAVLVTEKGLMINGADIQPIHHESTTESAKLNEKPVTPAESSNRHKDQRASEKPSIEIDGEFTENIGKEDSLKIIPSEKPLISVGTAENILSESSTTQSTPTREVTAAHTPESIPEGEGGDEVTLSEEPLKSTKVTALPVKTSSTNETTTPVQRITTFIKIETSTSTESIIPEAFTTSIHPITEKTNKKSINTSDAPAFPADTSPNAITTLENSSAKSIVPSEHTPGSTKTETYSVQTTTGTSESPDKGTVTTLEDVVSTKGLEKTLTFETTEKVKIKLPSTGGSATEETSTISTPSTAESTAPSAKDQTERPPLSVQSEATTLSSKPDEKTQSTRNASLETTEDPPERIEDTQSTTLQPQVVTTESSAVNEEDNKTVPSEREETTPSSKLTSQVVMITQSTQKEPTLTEETPVQFLATTTDGVTFPSTVRSTPPEKETSEEIERTTQREESVTQNIVEVNTTTGKLVEENTTPQAITSQPALTSEGTTESFVETTELFLSTVNATKQTSSALEDLKVVTSNPMEVSSALIDTTTPPIENTPTTISMSNVGGAEKSTNTPAEVVTATTVETIIVAESTIQSDDIAAEISASTPQNPAIPAPKITTEEDRPAVNSSSPEIVNELTTATREASVAFETPTTVEKERLISTTEALPESTTLAIELTTVLTCSDDWKKYCELINRTCFANLRSKILECGECLSGFKMIELKCIMETDAEPATTNVVSTTTVVQEEKTGVPKVSRTIEATPEASTTSSTPSILSNTGASERPIIHEVVQITEGSETPPVSSAEPGFTATPTLITKQETIKSESTITPSRYFPTEPVETTTGHSFDISVPSSTEAKVMTEEIFSTKIVIVSSTIPIDVPEKETTETTTSTTKLTPKITTTTTGTTTSTSTSLVTKGPQITTEMVINLQEVIKTEEPPINIDDGEEVQEAQKEEPFTTTTMSTSTSTISIPTMPSHSECISSDECGDDFHCDRRLGKCECNNGFRLKSNKCEDINECRENSHKCHKSSVCRNYIGGYTCDCPIGWRLNHLNQCIEIDECNERNNTLCHTKARCINLQGNYTCQCDDGYIGDGYICFEDNLRHCNEKELKMTSCNEGHLCLINVNGQENCEKCKSGYEMINGTCQDVNECINPDTNKCNINALCINTHGSYICECQNGYKGDGIYCEDVDECSLIKPCHPLARCSNLDGTYMCTCPEGWMGDGRYKCVNPLDRRCEHKEYLCSSEKFHSCLSLNVTTHLMSFCECEKGYRYNPTTKQCDDIDECLEGRSKCNSIASTCLNYMGGYACDCRQGFEGNGGVCVDVDECQRGVHGCHPTSNCYNEIGSYRCKCPVGYTMRENGFCELVIDTLTILFEELKITEKLNLETTIGLDRGTTTTSEVSISYRNTSEAAPNPEITLTSVSSTTEESTTISSTSSESSETLPLSATVADTQSPATLFSLSTKAAPISIKTTETVKSQPIVTQIFLTTQNQIPRRNKCTDDWKDYCNGLNKVCFVDSEDLLKCGECLKGYKHENGECIPQLGVGNCTENNNCHLNADCIDSIWTASVQNTHSCVCKKGYVGDGNQCEDVNECNTIPGLCDMNAECVNTDGSFECNCNSGYIGNGFYCLQHITHGNQTNCKTNTRLCHPKAWCLIDGLCQCQPGYFGDGIEKCDPVKSSTNKPFPAYDTTEKLPETNPSTSTSTILVSASFPSIISVSSPSDSTSTSTQTPLSFAWFLPPHSSFPLHEQTYIIPESSPSKFIPNCVLDKRIKCHPMSSCNTFSGQCKCRPGYEGDGFTHCSRVWEDCRSDSHLCDLNAKCNSTFGQCECNSGYIGDGLSCAPDRLDCSVHDDLCSEFADCIGKRCQCKEGYTGDGMMCFSMTAKLSRHDCLNCHCKANCVEGECKCQPGFNGNGLVCLPDPYDCINYPGVCHMNGYCSNYTRKCECRQEYVGNGYDCTLRKSCTQFPALCHPDADCLESGQCQCRFGFYGDGIYCTKDISYRELTQVKQMDTPSTECATYCGYNQECLNGACKCKTGFSANINGVCIDVDECLTGANSCSPQAKCHNSEGSYRCACPRGMEGDGHTCQTLQYTSPGVQVECLGDGMKVVFSNLPHPFSGRIYVKGLTDNEYCAKTYNGDTSQNIVFDVDLAHCNIYMRSNNTLMTTLIVQRHPTFVTSEAESYNVQCFYPLAERIVEAKYNIQDLEPRESIAQNGSSPVCQFKVKNLKDIKVDQALVGQILKLTLSVSPEPESAILPRNCYAINLESNDRYQLTDQSGCAIDTELFPEWKRISKTQLEAIFRTFKWPESTMIRFECYCTSCDEGCLEMKCEKRKQRLSRHIRKGQEEVMLDNRTLTFSQVVTVNEDEEERKVQKELERWLAGEESPTTSIINNDYVCMSSLWFLTTLMASILSIVTLITVFILYSKKMRVLSKQRFLESHVDDNVSYIQF